MHDIEEMINRRSPRVWNVRTVESQGFLLNMHEDIDTPVLRIATKLVSGNIAVRQGSGNAAKFYGGSIGRGL